ncbi:MAG: hypothetical protein OJJ54_04950 [Pseudonocardia sp.]|nr:hypothetical protein [Pseudonocardia sp.]
MPRKGLDPVREGLPAAVAEIVGELREIYTDGPYQRLRQVEDAIVAVRAGRPELVTVSSATCSRMLSPRRTSGGARTALPRWPSVVSFLVVHGRDPAPYEQRWEAARVAWAADEPGPLRDADSLVEGTDGTDIAAGAADDAGDGTEVRRVSAFRHPYPAATAVVAALVLVGIGIVIGRALPR